ncbi:LysR family transcriptional regulator [Motilimonas cestriensis]|uniref:LysR family transcriptional regulator n=1 Tax=Motilimonas cestriensis TaxID=2742685 RepID=UPI003DA51D76
MEFIDNMTHLETLRTFCLAAELNSFSASARHLNLPRATVSQRVSQLEVAVGVRLFKRTTRKIELSHEGEILYKAAKASLVILHGAIDDIQQKKALTGAIRLSVPALMPNNIMSSWIQEFSSDNPRVSIEIIASDSVSDLAFDNIDIAIRGRKVTSDKLVCRLWQSVPMYLVATPDSRQSRAVDDPIMDPLGCYKPIGNAKPRQSQISSNDLLTTLRLCLASYHAAYLPAPMISHHLDQGDLQTIAGLCEPSNLDIYLVYEAMPLLSPSARAMVAFLQEKMTKAG